MILVILILVLIPLGYGSGGGWKHIPSGVFSPLIGVVFGLLLGVYDLWLIGFAVAGWLSEKPSPAKQAMGAITDGYGTTDDYTDLAQRGAVSALLYLPLLYIAPVYPILAFIIAWPLSAYIGTKLPGSAWTWSETLRYFLVGVVVYTTHI
jgi:hypothetical protein